MREFSGQDEACQELCMKKDHRVPVPITENRIPMTESTKTATLNRFLSIRGLVLDRGARRVLDGVDLDLEKGEIFGLLGPNGAGKSSLFQALAGLIPVTAGEVALEGEALPVGDRRLLQRTGVVFQSPALDDRLSAQVNLRLAAGLYGLTGAEAAERADEALAFAELTDRAKDPVKELSGGMRRRLELARAFIHHPDFLLMDEPTTGLDEHSYQRAWEKIKALAKKGVTMLLTTHRAEEAALCDRLAILAGGRIAAVGSPEELRAKVGGDVVELVPEDPEVAVTTLKTKLDLTAEHVAGRVRIVADQAHELVPRIVEALPTGSLKSIAVHRPGLSDVFLALTGRTLEEDEA
jgi:ABC-2 type transport system ATP-binding protein